MPITLPTALPAFDLLRQEGVLVMSPDRAAHQDIRPLRIGLLNLMPNKIPTENQFARLIGATPLQIEFSLIRMSDYQPRNIPAEHMGTFYRTFREVCSDKFDGLIITGAPIEHLAYKEVNYWGELEEVFEWSRNHVHSTIGVCWGAMAMMHHFHGVRKHTLDAKAFGCFRQHNLRPSSPYLRGFSDEIVVPVSRWTTLRQEEMDTCPSLVTLLNSDETGPCLVEEPKHRALYVFNHFEYDADTLKLEYDRDRDRGVSVDVPADYFPNDDPFLPPPNRWRSHAHLLYGNWINEVYQSTPFEIDRIGE